MVFDPNTPVIVSPLIKVPLDIETSNSFGIT